MKAERNTDLPERIVDPVLGKLRFSVALDGVDEYQTKLTLDGRRVTFDLYTDKAGRLTSCIKRARRIVERFDAIKAKMQRYIEREVLPGFNENCRSGKEPLQIEQVMKRLKLQIDWFDPGNLFLGHALQLRMAERNTFVGFDMPG